MVSYATRSGGNAYHIVEDCQNRTVCGLKVSKLQSKRRQGMLFLLSEKPSDRSLCRHCARITVEEGD